MSKNKDLTFYLPVQKSPSVARSLKRGKDALEEQAPARPTKKALTKFNPSTSDVQEHPASPAAGPSASSSTARSVASTSVTNTSAVNTSAVSTSAVSTSAATTPVIGTSAVRTFTIKTSAVINDTISSSSPSSSTSTKKRTRSGKSILDSYVKQMGKAKDVTAATSVDLLAVLRCVFEFFFFFIDYGRLNSSRPAANLRRLIHIRNSSQNSADGQETIEKDNDCVREETSSEQSGNLETETQSDDPADTHPTRAFKRRMRVAAHSAAVPPTTHTEARNTKLASPLNKSPTCTSLQLSLKNPPHARPLRNKPAAGSSSSSPSSYGSPFAPSTATFVRAPVKESDDTPGFRRYSHLIDKSRSTGAAGPSLPDEYVLLEKISRALDHAMVFMKGQNRQCVFHKIKKSVEIISKRTFEMRHLAQIKTVAPDAYTFEAVQVQYQNSCVDSISIEFGILGVETNVPAVLSSPSRSRPSERSANSVPLLSSKQLESRHEAIKSRLLDLVKTEHEKFLATLPLRPEPSTPDVRLRHWHPRFNLETVPSVAQAPLPQVARNVVNPAALLKSKEGGLPPTFRAVLAKAAAKLEENKVSKPASEPTKVEQKGDAPAKPATGKSSMSALLERIRAKEKKKTEETMYGESPEKTQRRTMMSRLPDIVDSISFVFSSAKKNVMYLRDVGKKVSESYKIPLSEAEAEEHLRLLTEIVPDWCRLSSVDNGMLLKIEKSKTLGEVKARIREALVKL
ncbi:hypothetical protein BC937DRAFT_91899 [Endogone sp. FLAS-F59071]|nr:hypothetical protein BC937DRAFT_91899 [Endogone sp. FLAS-F59071]|eukprot:RUS15853.1 hypothetical protein BC937DRAFT_91899 [Endogone sp. FLAS-F59071]